jgi:hypothetical protein
VIKFLLNSGIYLHYFSTVCVEATCTSPSRYCGLGRGVSKCLCEDGFVRDANNDCIRESDCPVVDPPAGECPANEEHSDCGTLCPLTCANKDNPPPCAQMCTVGCFCTSGYVRDSSGKCIKETECPVVAPVCSAANEEYSKCDANSCQKSCAILNMNVACRPICTAGCICKEGYIHDDNGACILIADCPAPDTSGPTGPAP